MKYSDETILSNICDLMDRAKIPHNCNGDNIIEINKEYRIEIDKSTTPWRCTLMKNGEKVYSANPTGIVLATKAVLVLAKKKTKNIKNKRVVNVNVRKKNVNARKKRKKWKRRTNSIKSFSTL